MLTSQAIELARDIATSAHRGQLDKIRAPYIEHPAMVAFLVQLLPDFAAADEDVQEAAVCAAWLHDTEEDTAVTENHLKLLGFTPQVVAAVVALTRTDAVKGDDYYAKIAQDSVARLVKTADLASNLDPDRVARLDAATRERLDVRYTHALGELGVDRVVITRVQELGATRRAEPSNAGQRERRTVIDLHTHSNRSDGTDSPRTLVLKAYKSGVSHLAITDHDTTDGWAEAGEAADWVGLHLIRGIELSVKNEGRSQHLLAYEPDPSHPALAELLRRGLEAREERIPRMVELIRTKVSGLSLAAVQRKAGAGAPGRPHIAQALVECNACTSIPDAFERYLAPGAETYVGRWAPTIEDAIEAVVAAGGVAVIAHPLARGAAVSRERFEQLRACGLRGVEVNHREHGVGDRRALSEIALDLSLVVTGSSDYHGENKPNRLAEETTSLGQLEQLRSLWSGASVGS